MMLKVMDLCKLLPKMRVQICHASTSEVLFEGVLEDCPYRVCDMDIEKVEAQFVNGVDYLILAE